MRNYYIEKIRKLASQYKLSWSAEDLTSDKRAIYGRLYNQNLSLDVYFLKFDGRYYIDDIGGNGLTRELYPDTLAKSVTVAQRSEEITSNIEKILGKGLTFFTRPGFFNKQRGYIILPIDGQNKRIYQKSNVFGLPVAQKDK